jgi:hypothetical protein
MHALRCRGPSARERSEDLQLSLLPCRALGPTITMNPGFMNGFLAAADGLKRAWAVASILAARSVHAAIDHLRAGCEKRERLAQRPKRAKKNPGFAANPSSIHRLLVNVPLP